MSLQSINPTTSQSYCDLTRWFTEEVHRHEPSLKAYLRGAFPTVRDLDDLVQESYLRIWRAKLARPIISAKGFLFQVARHVAVDVLRRKAVAATESLGDLTGLPVADECPNAAEKLSDQERAELVAAAFLHLPPRCREVMTLRKLHGCSHQLIASRLGISERTVESQIARGMKLCEVYLRDRRVAGYDCD